MFVPAGLLASDPAAFVAAHVTVALEPIRRGLADTDAMSDAMTVAVEPIRRGLADARAINDAMTAALAPTIAAMQQAHAQQLAAILVGLSATKDGD